MKPGNARGNPENLGNTGSLCVERSSFKDWFPVPRAGSLFQELDTFSSPLLQELVLCPENRFHISKSGCQFQELVPYSKICLLFQELAPCSKAWLTLPRAANLFRGLARCSKNWFLFQEQILSFDNWFPAPELSWNF
jgi:hypothetical protein